MAGRVAGTQVRGQGGGVVAVDDGSGTTTSLVDAAAPEWQQEGFGSKEDYDAFQAASAAAAAANKPPPKKKWYQRLDPGSVWDATGGKVLDNTISKIPGGDTVRDAVGDYGGLLNPAQLAYQGQEYLAGGNPGGVVQAVGDSGKVPLVKGTHDAAGKVWDGVNWVTDGSAGEAIGDAVSDGVDWLGNKITPDLPFDATGGTGGAGGIDGGGTQQYLTDGLAGAGKYQPAPITTTQASRHDLPDPRQIKAATVSRAGTDIRAADPMQAVYADYQKLGPTQYAEAYNIGPMDQAADVRIDKGPQDQVRAQQMRTLQSLQGRSDGTAPSVVQMQLERARERNNANQFSFAASARGPQQAGALRRAMLNSGRLNAGASADAAEARVKEMDAATNTLASAQQGVRSSDIGLATSQANIDQSTGQFNTGQRNSGKLKQAELTTQTSQFNAGQGNDMTKAQGTLDQGTALHNSTIGTNTASTIYTTEQDRLAKNAGIAKDLNTTDAASENDARAANAKAVNEFILKDADLTAALEQFNASALNEASIKNLDAQLRAKGLNDAEIGMYLQALVTSRGQDTQLQAGREGMQWQASKDEADFYRNLLSTPIDIAAQYALPKPGK